MMEIMAIVVLISSMSTVSSYRSVMEQTDSSPWLTSIGERVSKHGCAVSEDYFKSGRLKYGDWLYIQPDGLPAQLRIVNDVMNPRHKNHIDLWVSSYDEERQIGLRRGKVYKIDLKENVNARSFW